MNPIPESVHRVLERVCASRGTSPNAVLDGSRFDCDRFARHEWIALVKDTWGLSQVETAILLHVDRATVRTAQARARARIEEVARSFS